MLRGGAARLLICCIVLNVIAGCSTKKKWRKHAFFVTEADTVKYLGEALDSPLPDERRSAIEQVTRTRYITHDVVADAFAVIADRDPSDSVRCAALIGLQKAANPRASATLADIIEREEKTRPRLDPLGADDRVLVAALQANFALIEQTNLPQEQWQRAQTTAIRMLETHRSRNVRQICARTLGYFQKRAVCEPLIAALEQRDFGVVYEAKRSLMRLTGQSFEHDADRWRAWLASTNTPFADAGRLDHQLDPPDKPWWKAGRRGNEQPTVNKQATGNVLPPADEQQPASKQLAATDGAQS